MHLGGILPGNSPEMTITSTSFPSFGRMGCWNSPWLGYGDDTGWFIKDKPIEMMKLMIWGYPYPYVRKPPFVIRLTPFNPTLCLSLSLSGKRTVCEPGNHNLEKD